MTLPPRKRRARTSTRQEAVQNADDAERQALAAGAEVESALDEALLDDRVSESIMEAALPGGEEARETSAVQDALELDTYAEGIVGMASEVIRDRASMLGKSYPFVLQGNHIRYRGSKTGVYEFCLSVTSVQNIAAPQFRDALCVFEQLSGLVMSCFVGTTGQYYHTGYPGSGRILELHLPLLTELMPHEWIWDTATLRDRANDGGVDVVVWKSPDSRRNVGSLVFVGNSGCGRSWLHLGKHRARPSIELSRLLSRPKPQHLHDFLCLPFHVYDEQEWAEACHYAVFVLDRVRLAAIAESQDVATWQREICRLTLPIDEATTLLYPSARVRLAAHN